MTIIYNRFRLGGPECLDVSRLFRRTADVLDDLGQVEVLDVVFGRTPTAVDEHPALVVYYGRQRPSEDGRGRAGRRKANGVTSNAENSTAEHRVTFADDYARQFLAPDVQSLTMNNPFTETGLYSVPKLLRRTAELLDVLNDLITDDTLLRVEDTVLERKQDPAKGPVPSLTVYYSRCNHNQ